MRGLWTRPLGRLLRALAALAAWAALVAAGPARAQALDPAAMRSAVAAVPDLQFPQAAQPPTDTDPQGMVMWKPEGAGPFPALVLLHSCGGLRHEMYGWARRAVQQGYVALVLDSLGPRGLKNVCSGTENVRPPRGAKDAFDALEALRGQPFVDAKRIGLLGFSWGAMAGLLASSPEVAAALEARHRFAATASFYPICWFGGTRLVPRQVEFLRADVDRPLLVLMGERDTEAPPADCLPRLEALKAHSAPVEWELYPGQTHCWDCAGLDGFHKLDLQGHSVSYFFDAKATDESARRAFRFFAERMPAGGG